MVVAMDRLAEFLQAVGYHAVILQPLLPMYLHLILSALFPIYAGAHASLSRPSSAAKPPKKKKRPDEDEDELEEEEQKMEGMSPSDAIMLPLLAGGTLAGLYFLIKWLEDPAVLNKILNWYFSMFGVLALARLITDCMGTVTSFALPSMFIFDNKVWDVDSKAKVVRSHEFGPVTRDSPLPGLLAKIPLSKSIKKILWNIRELPSQRLHIRAHIRNIFSSHFKLGPQGLLAFQIALIAQIYFNFVDKPWWLTNALGFSFAYSALQIMSPTTSWTGTLVLGALFLYDIYFVFFTPMMVAVATKLDIPAKLLFPRPGRPGDDPAKQAMSMLGLGDVVLPGMMIGFAVRFDLYLFYLRKQTRREVDKSVKKESASEDGIAANEEIEKDTWYPAKGGWGERFWASRTALVTSEEFHGTVFPKTYFHASLIGYVAGMLCTLGVMQVFGHAQPALLYLVPGVLGAIWGTALVKGDIKTLWAYSEADEEDEEAAKKGKGGKQTAKAEGSWSDWSSWKSIFSLSNTKKKIEDLAKDPSKIKSEQSEQKPDESKADTTDKDTPRSRKRFHRDPKTELIFLSINSPSSTPSTQPKSESSEEDATKTTSSRTKAPDYRGASSEADTEPDSVVTRTYSRTKPKDRNLYNLSGSESDEAAR